MKKPKISIITIAYNCANDIEDTIKSVISQKYDNKEYIIIDGASTDGTMDVVKRYKDHIDVIVSEPDKGRSDAFNKGIERSTGDYLVMMNAGDLLAEDALNKFAKAYKPGYDVIKGNTIRWNADTGYKSREIPVVKYNAIPFHFHVCHQSTYISLEAYRKYGVYDTSMKIVMDFDLMLRFTRGGARFIAIDEDLAIFKMGGLSQTSNITRLKEMAYAMKKNGHNAIETQIFVCYIIVRTFIRDILNKIHPDIKNRIATNTI